MIDGDLQEIAEGMVRWPTDEAKKILSRCQDEAIRGLSRKLVNEDPDFNPEELPVGWESQLITRFFLGLKESFMNRER